MSASSLAAFGNELHGCGCEEEEALWERWGEPDAASREAAARAVVRLYGGVCLCRGAGLDVDQAAAAARLIIIIKNKSKSGLEAAKDDVWTRGETASLMK